MFTTIGLLKQQLMILIQNPNLYFSLLPFFLFTYFLLKWLVLPPSTIRKTSIPSPSKLPLIGNLHQVGLHPHRTFMSLAKKYGPIMLLHFGSVPVLVVSSSDGAKEIMKNQDLIFANRPKSKVGMKLVYNCKDVASAPYGEYWRQMKSVCILHLLSNKMVQSFRAVREEEISILIKTLEEFPRSNLSVMFQSLGNDVISRVAFGRKYSGGNKSSEKFKRLLDEFMKLLGSFTIGEFIHCLSWVNHVNGFNARVEKTALEFDEFLDGIVEEHILKHNKDQERIKANNDTNVKGFDSSRDFVDILLELQRNNKHEYAIERDSIKALILDMFLGGTDTSSTVLEWAMAELVKNPRVMKELKDEVQQIMLAKKSSPTNKLSIIEEDLEKMHYLKIVIKETLRLHPPIPLLSPRESTQDSKVMGYDVPSGTMVFTNMYAIGRDPEIWTKPEEFWPERFLDSINTHVDFKGDHHDFRLIPFGAGRRGCPGITFSIKIIELVLANLVSKFDWKLPGEVKCEELDMTEGAGLTIHRKHPLVLIATPTS